MEVILVGIVTDFSDVHPLKSPAAIDAIVEGIVIDTSDVHESKELAPIESTLVGMVIVTIGVNLKTLLAIDVTLVGIVKFLRPVYENA